MLSQLKQPMFQRVWQRIQKEAAESDTSPYVFLRNLDSLGIEDGDPLQISAQRRWLRGLRGPTGV